MATQFHCPSFGRQTHPHQKSYANTIGTKNLPQHSTYTHIANIDNQSGIQPIQNITRFWLCLVATFTLLILLPTTNLSTLNAQPPEFHTTTVDTTNTEPPNPYDQLGQLIESSISEAEPLVFNDAFDKAQMLDKILAFVVQQSDSRIEINKNQLLKDFSDNFNIGEQVIQWMGIDGFYDFITYHKQNNKNYLLFRLYAKNGNVNYHDFELGNQTDTLKITDIYIYAAGDFITNIMGQIFLPLITTDDTPIQNNQPSKRQIFLSAINTLETVKQCAATGDYQQAVRQFELIPQEYQKQKKFQLTLLAFADKISPQYYQNAIDNYEKQYTNDPSLPLILLDKLFLQKNYTATLQCIDKLSEKVFNDPFLNFQRANIYWAMADTANAIKTAQILVDSIPDFIDGHLSLLIYAIEARKYNIAIAEMQTMVEWFAYDKPAIEQMLTNEFPDFVQSDTFQKWQPIQNQSDEH